MKIKIRQAAKGKGGASVDQFVKERKECESFGHCDMGAEDCKICKEEDATLHKTCVANTKEEEMKVKVKATTEAAAKKVTSKAVKGGKKVVAEKKAKVAGDVSKFGGHRPGSGGFIMDAAIAKGGTIETIAKNAAVEVSRLRGHIQFLKANRGVTFTESKTGVITAHK